MYEIFFLISQTLKEQPSIQYYLLLGKSSDNLPVSEKVAFHVHCSFGSKTLSSTT